MMNNVIKCKCKGAGCGCCFGAGKLIVVKDLVELYGDPEYRNDESGVIEWWAREVNGE